MINWYNFFISLNECFDRQDEAYEYRIYMKNNHIINDHIFFRYSIYFTDEKYQPIQSHFQNDDV